MANTTVIGAKAIHGQNPQYLVETVIRSRIYECTFWKEHCFALTAATIIDKSIELRTIGGVYGARKGNITGISPSRRIQVSTCFGRNVHTDDLSSRRRLRDSRTSPKRLQETAPAGDEWIFVDIHGRVCQRTFDGGTCM
ncbi:hypothetical protein Agabi119p4_3252 [Agaricus bisporus var. burnettii]|uniref:Pre-mRNA-splicing factor 38 n=1 Tax=Agaricus bisporus var. burnettii TaxID=192524 RepID=A0A8H7F6Q1_AGABI|nr:hypothetical protein Agabi119p4_3252 [Agaricus bisporus var. burnettii]